MTNSALASMDAVIHRQLAAAGLAEPQGEAVYYATANDDGVPVRCYVDRGLQSMGELGQVIGSRTVLGILRADVPDPQQGAIVELIKMGVVVERFVLEAPDASSDESLSRWVVSHG